MADVFSRLKRSQVMAAIKSKGNKETELRLAEIFRAHRIIGWRRNQTLPGKPDFTFRKLNVAVFVDGCFWHGCRKHFRMPKSNRPYWRRKLAKNQARDREINRQLKRGGWCVLRVWQHELKNEHKSLLRVLAALARKAKTVHKQSNLRTTMPR
jgi:DNA mismatch endonuclease (patch repair protein)